METSENKQGEGVELFGPGSPLPAAVALAQETAAIKVEDLPPMTGRNAGMAFSFDPIDETRLGELLSVMNQLGFIVQTITVRRSSNEFSIANISFGQVADPRSGLPTSWRYKDLKPGNVVRLREGTDTKMTVDRVKYNEAECVWFEGTDLKRETFGISQLVVTTP